MVKETGFFTLVHLLMQRRKDTLSFNEHVLNHGHLPNYEQKLQLKKMQGGNSLVWGSLTILVMSGFILQPISAVDLAT